MKLADTMETHFLRDYPVTRHNTDTNNTDETATASFSKSNFLSIHVCD